MPSDDFDAMTAACIEAAAQVNLCGSPELKTAMRVVLFVLGKEVASRIDLPPSDTQHQPNGNGQG